MPPLLGINGTRGRPVAGTGRQLSAPHAPKHLRLCGGGSWFISVASSRVRRNGSASRAGDRGACPAARRGERERERERCRRSRSPPRSRRPLPSGSRARSPLCEPQRGTVARHGRAGYAQHRPPPSPWRSTNHGGARLAAGLRLFGRQGDAQPPRRRNRRRAGPINLARFPPRWLAPAPAAAQSAAAAPPTPATVPEPCT